MGSTYTQHCGQGTFFGCFDFDFCAGIYDTLLNHILGGRLTTVLITIHVLCHFYGNASPSGTTKRYWLVITTRSCVCAKCSRQQCCKKKK